MLKRIGNFDKIEFCGIEILCIAGRQFGLVMFCYSSLKSIRQLPAVLPAQVCREIRDWLVDSKQLILSQKVIHINLSILI